MAEEDADIPYYLLACPAGEMLECHLLIHCSQRLFLPVVRALRIIKPRVPKGKPDPVAQSHQAIGDIPSNRLKESEWTFQKWIKCL